MATSLPHLGCLDFLIKAKHLLFVNHFMIKVNKVIKNAIFLWRCPCLIRAVVTSILKQNFKLMSKREYQIDLEIQKNKQS